MTDVGKAIRSALATARHIAAPLTRAKGGAARADGGPVVGGAAGPQSDSAAPPVAGSLAPPPQKKPSIAPPVAQPRHLNGLGMYSHAVEEALRLPQVRGAPNQMLASLKGVKPEELAHSGAAQKFAGQKHVTREELAGHFFRSLPRVHESTYSDDGDDEDEDGNDNRTQYEEYTVPGGKNYREVLLHTPAKRAGPPTPELYKALQTQMDTGRAATDYLWKHAKDSGGLDNPEYQRLLALAHEARRDYHTKQQAHVAAAEAENYKHQHWPVPNVVAHLRLSDRQIPTNEPYFRWRNQASRFTSQDFPTREAAEAALKTYPESTQGRVKLEQGDSGRFEKALHLEELQSDWGQAGRENGFVGDREATLKRLLAARDAAPDGPLHMAAQAKLNEAHEMPFDTVKGPHVTTTNGWADLGLKRALLEAARGGHDRLVWTPGAEQARRYGMSNHIDELYHWRHPSDGLVGISAYDKAGHAVYDQKYVSEAELKHHVGEEMAKTILSGGGDPAHPSNVRVLRGADLEVGGEGHKEFYDKIVPIRLKEILKKLGHEAKFDQVRVSHKPKNPTSLDAAMGDLLSGKRDVAQDMRTTLHSLKLTPELRDKIKKGLPAFARGGAALTHSPTGAYAGMAKEHGYSGVANPKAAYPMAAMFGKVPVSPRGPQTPAAGGDIVDRALDATRGWSTP